MLNVYTHTHKAEQRNARITFLKRRVLKSATVLIYISTRRAVKQTTVEGEDGAGSDMLKSRYTMIHIYNEQ